MIFNYSRSYKVWSLILVQDGSKGNSQLLFCWGFFLKSNYKNYLPYTFTLIFLSVSSVFSVEKTKKPPCLIWCMCIRYPFAYVHNVCRRNSCICMHRETLIFIHIQ